MMCYPFPVSLRRNMLKLLCFMLLSLFFIQIYLYERKDRELQEQQEITQAWVEYADQMHTNFTRCANK